MLTYTEAAELLRTRDNILILTHKRPDGDTVGCAVALCAALRNLGKQAFILANEDATTLFTPYLEGYVANGDYEPAFVVSVDIAGRGLFTPGGEAWLEKGIDLSFDHHPSYEGFGKACCVDATRAACGELIYDVVCALGTVTAEIALPLYVAVTTDTGCFQYGNTTPGTHRVAAALMETGIDYLGVNKRHFRTKSLIRMRLESLLIENMELFDDGAIGITALSLEDMANLSATERDAEDVAAFLGQLEGVKTSVTIRELAGGECKLSVRTGAELNATKVCALLGGGGHAAAAGCTISGGVAHAREEIMKAIRTVQHG